MSPRRFEAMTQYDEAAYSALVHLMIHKLRKAPRIMLLVLGFAGVIVSAAAMLMQGQLSALWLIILLLGNVLCMLGLFMKRFTVKMMMASAGKTLPEFHYCFDESGMTVRTQAGEKQYAYADVVRTLEMSGYLFFFCRDQQVYLLRQADVKGSQGDFRPFLEEMLSRKGEAP